MSNQNYWQNATPRLQQLHQQVIQQRIQATIEELRGLMEKAEMSGISESTMDEIRQRVREAIAD